MRMNSRNSDKNKECVLGVTQINAKKETTISKKNYFLKTVNSDFENFKRFIFYSRQSSSRLTKISIIINFKLNHSLLENFCGDTIIEYFFINAIKIAEAEKIVEIVKCMPVKMK